LSFRHARGILDTEAAHNEPDSGNHDEGDGKGCGDL
jgi:hypothetical protein